MALNITAQGDAKLTIQGTSIEVASIYGRLEIGLAANGINMQVNNGIYEARANYKAGDSILRISELSGTLYNFIVDVAAGEEQSLTLTHSKLQSDLEDLGYSVSIIDL